MIKSTTRQVSRYVCHSFIVFGARVASPSPKLSHFGFTRLLSSHLKFSSKSKKMGGHQTQAPCRISRDFIAGRKLATAIMTKKGKVKKKTPDRENNIPTMSKEQPCFKCHKFGHISSECTITTITNEEICLMTRGNSHATGMLGRKKADDYCDGDSKSVSKSDCDIDYSFSNDEDTLVNLSLNNKVSQSSSSNLSHRSTSSQSVECQQKHTSQRTIGASPERDPRNKPEKGSFDIFRTTNVGLVKLKKSILVLNREEKRDSERLKNASEPQYLRSGMVLLKNCLNNSDQVQVLNKCRELGIGSGGFYRPGYSNGTKLHLQMMCLGKDWDPESKSYKSSRHFDGALPPEIPGEFKKLVDDALHAAHNFLRRSSKSVEEIPNMSPDVCIVNFYNNSGKLGLHQDIDESKESLKKELPVISFSIGDSAEFLYGDVRDADNAEKVMLESGDVLIFGGKSRLIFHGVSSVKLNTAPMFLSNKTAFSSGRLNLTFRQV